LQPPKRKLPSQGERQTENHWRTRLKTYSLCYQNDTNRVTNCFVQAASCKAVWSNKVWKKISGWFCSHFLFRKRINF